MTNLNAVNGRGDLAKKIEIREGDTVTIRLRTGQVFGKDYDKQVVLMLPTGPQAVALSLLGIVKKSRRATTGRTTIDQARRSGAGR